MDDELEILDRMNPPKDFGWVIERHFNSELRYWGGRGTKPKSFTNKDTEAIRFSREEDAALVLSWCFDGNGRVALHGWIRERV